MKRSIPKIEEIDVNSKEMIGRCGVCYGPIIPHYSSYAALYMSMCHECMCNYIDYLDTEGSEDFIERVNENNNMGLILQYVHFNSEKEELLECWKKLRQRKHVSRN